MEANRGKGIGVPRASGAVLAAIIAASLLLDPNALHAPEPRIPLCEGRNVTAINQAHSDYESIMTFASAFAAGEFPTPDYCTAISHPPATVAVDSASSLVVASNSRRNAHEQPISR